MPQGILLYRNEPKSKRELYKGWKFKMKRSEFIPGWRVFSSNLLLGKAYGHHSFPSPMACFLVLQSSLSPFHFHAPCASRSHDLRAFHSHSFCGHHHLGGPLTQISSSRRSKQVYSGVVVVL